MLSVSEIECQYLVADIGEPATREVVRRADLPSSTGIAQEGFDYLESLLAQHTPRLHTMFGAKSEAIPAIEALRKRYRKP